MKAVPQKMRAFAQAIIDNPHLDPRGGDGATLAKMAGYSEKSARQMASLNMKDARCLAMIGDTLEAREKKERAKLIGSASVERGVVDANDLADIRQRTVARMLQLAEQEENLNVTYKACEWLGRYSRAIEYAKGKDDAAHAVTGGDTMDPEVAKAVRKAKRDAERRLAA